MSLMSCNIKRMRILVVGAGGMLGHKLLEGLSRGFEVAGSIRAAEPDSALTTALPHVRLFGGVVAEDLSSVERVLDAFRPHAVANCIGIIKQDAAAKDPIRSITVNALFPHQLARLCVAHNARLIHFSTDCVFSGTAGAYTEDDPPDPQDLYGRTKLLGEVAEPGCLTIRSSIVGHELRTGMGLVEWFMTQRGGRVRGFANALYTGLTTLAMSELVACALNEWPSLDGLWQVASDPISKYDLLGIVNRVYGLGISIERDEAFHCDRRLDGSRFRARTGWSAPSWETMVEAMRADYDASAAYALPAQRG
jgi:dTDP-4-dehydrorhamnose reductase